MELSSPLANQYSKGKDEYPMDLTLAYSLLVNYCTPTNAVRHNTGSHNNNSTSVQNNNPASSAANSSSEAPP
jgi:hypothetical protein